MNLIAEINTLPLLARIAVFAGIAIVVHLLVIILRRLVYRFLHSKHVRKYQKARSIATLTTSAVIFTLYFLAIGLILQEFGVQLTTYLASASVIALAIGFGAQGIVQDVVMGLTFVFSDLVDVGDVVEISAQTGIVKGITMRFVELENALGARVFIPNRTVNNVVNYPRGYIRCLVDITLVGEENEKAELVNTATLHMKSIHSQFPGILMVEPSVESRKVLPNGREFIRVKFRIWPNRGQPIETTFCQGMLAHISKLQPDYSAWMISTSYEAEDKLTVHAVPWSISRLKR